MRLKIGNKIKRFNNSYYNEIIIILFIINDNE